MWPSIRRLLRADDQGAVGLLFGLAVVPLVMIVGLAIDYSFYIQVRAQVNLAADAAAMHAASVASRVYNGGQASVSAVEQAGQAAGQQWFAAQLGTLTNGTVSPNQVQVNVTYTVSPSQFAASVTYTGTVATHFSGLFHVSSFPMSGGANAVISTSYVEVLMLLDASGSMLIGASLSDIVALEQATPCSTQSANAGQSMGAYSWIYSNNYGYNSSNTAPTAAQNGNCDPNYNGDPAACPYVTTFANISLSNTYRCTNGGGAPATIKGVNYPNMPQAPCAFACHNDQNSNDYYGLARSLNPPIQLRLDVVQNAAAAVISTLQQRQQVPNQFSVGIYQFNTALSQAYPNSSEAGTDLTKAQNIALSLKNETNVIQNSADTDFLDSIHSLNNIVSAAGNGSTPSSPLKNLFIVTDGLADFNGPNGRQIGPFTSTTNETLCSLFWSKGFNVYVLYTPYLSLPNPYYINNTSAFTQPADSSPDVAALQACARYPSNYFEASNPAAINSAMQNMLAKALNAPGRVAK